MNISVVLPARKKHWLIIYTSSGHHITFCLFIYLFVLSSTHQIRTSSVSTKTHTPTSWQQVHSVTVLISQSLTLIMFYCFVSVTFFPLSISSSHHIWLNAVTDVPHPQTAVDLFWSHIVPLILQWAQVEYMCGKHEWVNEHELTH